MTRIVAGVLAALLIAAAGIVGYGYLRGKPATRLRPGDPLPDLELPAVEGGAVARLRQNLGPATVVVFVNTRWTPMTRYAEVLERLNRRYTRRGFRMVGVCLDESKDLCRDFIQRNAITFTVLHDPGGRASSAGFGAVTGPESYLVDGSGRVVASFAQPVDWRRDEQRARVEALLPSPSPGAW